MAVWSNKTWLSRGKAERVVDPWDDARVKEADYILSVGAEYYVNSDDGRSVARLEENEGFSISPGQFVFILTEERLRIPKDSIALISARASTKFRGLVNVSGFQVNPGFDGNFIFAMFNAGPMVIHLRRGDKVFSMWLMSLDEAIDEQGMKDGNIPNTLSSIPSDVINGISSKALTAYQVNESVAELRKDLIATKARFTYLQIAMVLIFGMVLFLFGPELRDRFSMLMTGVPAADGSGTTPPSPATPSPPPAPSSP
jgi:dCTP deaminase